MRTSDYWEHFLSTGRIDDYLAYRNEDKKWQEEAGRADLYAGTGQGYRDDSENRTSRRVQ